MGSNLFGSPFLGRDEKDAKDSLIQFVKQYDNCLGSRVQAEKESDAADFHTGSYRVQPNPPLKLSFNICTLIKSLRKSKHS
ncbi:hypothetical protein Ahy_A10g049996 [Arachis hypogaea]|uniref:Uncharacterized protein n=1 Tax=Arachis hypogaea TaxID=3818 RepID=A0A445B8F0_ARAHY|nr:hypothetical protein Ahy_A10g049996 [Arachis hypogaea]